MNLRRLTARCLPFILTGRIAHLSYGRRLLRCAISTRLMTEVGQNPNPSLTVAFPLSPAADMPAVSAWAARSGREQMQQLGCAAELLDHLVGEGEQLVRNDDPDSSGSRDIDDQLELGRLHDRKIGLLRVRPSPARFVAAAVQRSSSGETLRSASGNRRIHDLRYIRPAQRQGRRNHEQTRSLRSTSPS
jgi:hypothetical protein